MSKEIMQQALFALKTCGWDYDYEEESYQRFDNDLVNDAVEALEAELAKIEPVMEPANSASNFVESKHLAQPEQERLSLRLDVGGGIARASAACGDQIESVAQELPKREWQGLTDEEIKNVWQEIKDAVCLDHQTFARAIEAKLREKNT